MPKKKTRPAKAIKLAAVKTKTKTK